MYSMCAERIAAEGGTTLVWHALDTNGDALCARPVRGTAAWTPEAVNGLDEYCRDCMNAVAMAFRPASRAPGDRTAVGGGAAERQADSAPPDPERLPHGR
ncbi:hypothetical protein [Streptomyces marianii]|uniref:Uncharacterized protein n=1 Tax=Streptomyces marianii TaxID=1817406 RepID=A0A5R9DXF2_9ACTN|nr:hypothetical protein [Streptomyces marianii]TLQ42331.1 hypothetical protein FEF34_03070 [Streptomyces marianii]